MSRRSWPIVFSTTSYFALVCGFLAFGTGACATTPIFLPAQEAWLKPLIVIAAMLKLAIEQISAVVRSLISGAAARPLAVASTAARAPADVVAVTSGPSMMKCRSDLLLPG